MKEKWECHWGCGRKFNTKTGVRFHQNHRCKIKSPRNPMSLKNHIINEHARISNLLGRAHFRKFIITEFNNVLSSKCEVEECENQATGWGGVKEDGTMRYVCKQATCKIFCEVCGANPLVIGEYELDDLCDKCKEIFLEEEKESEEYEVIEIKINRISFDFDLLKKIFLQKW